MTPSRRGRRTRSRRTGSTTSPTSSTPTGGPTRAGASRTDCDNRTREFGGDGPDGRERAIRALCEREHPPGVVTYLDGRPVAWCNIGPRSEIPRLVRSTLILPTDDLPVWSIICIAVRGGHRRQSVVGHLLDGAVAYAAANGAPAVEAHPVDPAGWMDTTMAFVGTRSMFEKAGFSVVGTTDAVASKMPRLVMRHTLQSRPWYGSVSRSTGPSAP